MNPVGPWLLLVGPLIFLGLAFVTRATLPRAFAALLGGLVAGAFNVAVDLLGNREGWWRYPGMGERGYGPIEWYVTGALAFGAGVGLLGWRLHRRFGLRGLAECAAGTTGKTLFLLFPSGVLEYGVRTDHSRLSQAEGHHMNGFTPLRTDYWGLYLLISLIAACAGQTKTVDVQDRASTDALVFRSVRIFDGSKVIPEGEVLVVSGKIVAVDAKVNSPAGATVIDGHGDTLLPGLIDSHAHIWDAEQLKQSLVFGTTTVLDMFTEPHIAAALRARVATPEGVGLADFRSAGNAVTAPKGHGTEYGFTIRTINGPAEAPSFVDSCIAEGSDYIKIIYDPRNPRVKSISRDTLAAVITAAHRRNKLVLVHIEQLEDAREAIEAGADGLAHLFLGKPPDAGFAELAQKKKAFVIPTLSVLKNLSGSSAGVSLVSDPELKPYLSSSDVDSLTQSFAGHGPQLHLDIAVVFETVRELKAKNVPILVGTDARNPGTTYGASVHGELELLVQAGHTPLEALIAATSAPAAAFSMNDRGRIAPGLRADLVLVRGDPTRDIKATRSIVGVWRLGTAVDRQGYKTALQGERAGALAERPLPPPAGSEPGLVSDFEDGKPSSKFGRGWEISTDQLRGGKSEAMLNIVTPGAGNSKGALAISGSVIANESGFAWAGAILSPGGSPMVPANLSSKKEIMFWAKGDGKIYDLLLFTKSRGYRPAQKTFATKDQWQEYRFKLSDFEGLDGHDLTGVFFGAGSAGAFSFQIDNVAFK